MRSIMRHAQVHLTLANTCGMDPWLAHQKPAVSNLLHDCFSTLAKNSRQVLQGNFSRIAKNSQINRINDFNGKKKRLEWYIASSQVYLSETYFHFAKCEKLNPKSGYMSQEILTLQACLFWPYLLTPSKQPVSCGQKGWVPLQPYVANEICAVPAQDASCQKCLPHASDQEPNGHLRIQKKASSTAKWWKSVKIKSWWYRMMLWPRSSEIPHHLWYGYWCLCVLVSWCLVDVVQKKS